MTTQLTAGDRAPEFSLPDQSGVATTLQDLLSEGPAVIYFYPKDETPGCTKEACSFRDQYAAFQDAGAQVIGISSDSVQSHADFAAHHRLPFRLLSDEGGRVRKQFGVAKTVGFLDGRVTFVIDGEGVIRHAFSSQLQVGKHIDRALDVVRELSKGQTP